MIVVGGGAAAVSSAANIATTWPDKRIDLYFPGERALGGYHPRIWKRIRGRLTELGVGLHPGHRAVISDGSAGDQITSEPVAWSTGQPPASADAVLWAIGRVQPNTDWLPPELLDEHGFVRVTPELRVPGHPGVFAVGDIAATDPLRSSARNRGDRWWPTTSVPSSRATAAHLSERRGGGGARWWASRPTGWRCSCPPARRSAPRLVGPTGGDAVGCPLGHVSRGARKRPVHTTLRDPRHGLSECNEPLIADTRQCFLEVDLHFARGGLLLVTVSGELRDRILRWLRQRILPLAFMCALSADLDTSMSRRPQVQLLPLNTSGRYPAAHGKSHAPFAGAKAVGANGPVLLRRGFRSSRYG